MLSTAVRAQAAAVARRRAHEKDGIADVDVGNGAFVGNRLSLGTLDANRTGEEGTQCVRPRWDQGVRSVTDPEADFSMLSAEQAGSDSVCFGYLQKQSDHVKKFNKRCAALPVQHCAVLRARWC
jgi:hypothetical protein